MGKKPTNVIFLNVLRVVVWQIRGPVSSPSHTETSHTMDAQRPITIRLGVKLRIVGVTAHLAAKSTYQMQVPVKHRMEPVYFPLPTVVKPTVHVQGIVGIGLGAKLRPTEQGHGGESVLQSVKSLKMKQNAKRRLATNACFRSSSRGKVTTLVPLRDLSEATNGAPSRWMATTSSWMDTGDTVKTTVEHKLCIKKSTIINLQLLNNIRAQIIEMFVVLENLKMSLKNYNLGKKIKNVF